MNIPDGLSSYFYRANFVQLRLISANIATFFERLDIRADTNDTHNLVNDTNNLWMRKDFSTVILGMIVDIVDVNSDCIPSNRKNILAFCNPL
ncbi:unnamed protein product [Rhizophagus irregularis]|nr:unnamed protein product [Rhizophagus irregularis]